MAISISNQWAGTFSQPVTFGTTPPALESVVVPLTSGSSVGGGSGTPTAGRWLFCLVAMNEPSTSAGFTVGVGDDIHSFWRPGNETTSTWAVSTGTALTRTAIWYTANTSRIAGNVYVAPNGCFDALAVLVVEVNGLGPWDTVTGINTNYSAAATTLNLALSAPSGAAFLIGAVGGDNNANGPSFAPASWTALHTVSATNGSDHTSDAQLASAWFTTSGSISVNGTATSATDLSGAVIGVLQTGTSPVPAVNNPNWPFLKFEAAFGGGFQTPPDQLTWTDLSSRVWSWDETTGIQFQLNQIQATNLDLELDNFDNALSYDNASGAFYPHVVTGTPLRIRAALGSIGGQSVNRWYQILRNAQEWPQEIDPAYRRTAPATGTDIWSVLSSSGPSPYRGEIEQDSPYAWWPMDDQPLTGGVQPTTLRNAAAGNSNTLAITASPNGVSAQDPYSTGGTHITTVASGAPLPGVAVYAVGQQQGWLYGDPSSSPQSSAASGPVTANPGAAAWQQSGALGTGGSNGWFLTCNDASFPTLSGGITVEGWFNAGFFASAAGFQPSAGTDYTVCGQPYSPQTIATLSTGSAPVVILQLDRATGNLNLITYNGTTPTTHSVYTASDLRGSSWHSVNIQLTTTTWAVYVDAGLTASASGTVSAMTSAWTWLTLNGDYGNTHGGTTPASIENGGNVLLSHWMVFGKILPVWRLLAHYCAGLTGFGVIPAPVPQISFVFNGNSPGTSSNTGYSLTPDGTVGFSPKGSYGDDAGSLGNPNTFTVSAVATINAGSFTSGPSLRATIAAAGQKISGTSYGGGIWISWTGTGPLYTVYTAASADAETAAATASGSGDSFTSGYGSGASGAGTAQVGSGSGASPPASPSALGDTVGQRLERILGYGNAPYPGRCIDPASLAVQAALDVGGQQAGQNEQNIAQSDGGLLFVDSQGNLTYWQKSHLAAQYSSPAWTLTPNAPPTQGASATAIPYYRQGFRWTADPQRVWNAVQITPYSPDGSSLATITPSSASSVTTSQNQFGAQPFTITSYLQDETKMQSQADWVLSNFGVLQIRVEGVKVDAAAYPAAWPLVLGISVGDLVTCQNWVIAGGGPTGTFRVSSLKRVIRFGDDEELTEASVVLQLDYEPPSYWS